MAPTPSSSTTPAPAPVPQPAPRPNNPTNYIHVLTIPTNGLLTCPNPPHPGTIITSTKKTNFAIIPKYPPPIEAYISAVEQASSKLPNHEAEKFRSDVNKLLKQQQSHWNDQCNITPPCRALTLLKQDNSRVVLTADKGVVMVIMDQEEYTNKALTLLEDTNTYKVLKKDPTSQLKNKLITILKDIKHTGGLSMNKYKQLYPTSAVPPSFMAFQKYTK